MKFSFTQRAVLLAFTTCMLSAPFQSQTATEATAAKAQVQRAYVTILTEDGYQPDLDSDGDVRFKREGRTYFIHVFGDDPGYFRLVLANVMKIDSEANRAKVQAAADYVSGHTKVAKVFTVRDNVWLSAEGFAEKPEAYKSVLRRYLSALDSGARQFVARLAPGV